MKIIESKGLTYVVSAQELVRMLAGDDASLDPRGYVVTAANLLDTSVAYGMPGLNLVVDLSTRPREVPSARL